MLRGKAQPSNWNQSAQKGEATSTLRLGSKNRKRLRALPVRFRRWGECVDCTTVLIAESAIENARQSFLNYVKEVGLGAIDYESKIPEIPRFQHGVVEIADVVNLGRSDNIGEISLHVFSLPYLVEAAKAGATPNPPDFVAILRSGLSLQIKWVVSLYDKG